MIRRYLLHERLAVRFVALCGLGLVGMYASWALAYALLPEAALRGKSIAVAIATDEALGSVTAEFIRIAAINLAVATFCVVLPNRMLHVNGYPLGYLPPLLWFVYYGALLGSNSFAIPLPHRLPPSLAVFARSGPYEIAAYCLVAASTHAIAVASSPRFFSLASRPVEPRPLFMEGIDKRGIAAGVLMLLAANLWEAYRIVLGF